MDPIEKQPLVNETLPNQIDPMFQVMPKVPSQTHSPTPTVNSTPPPAPTPAPVAPAKPIPGGLVPPLPPPPPIFSYHDDSGPSSMRRPLFFIVIAIIVIVLIGGFAFFLLGRKTPSSQNSQQAASQLPTVWLKQYFAPDLNASGACQDQTICGDNADPDHDGLTNYQEFKQGTDPTNPDTDGDGLADGDEVNVYLTDPTLKFTDRRDIVAQNNWTDGFQIMNGYDPLTPGLKFTDVRNQQIATDIAKYGLHAPTTTTLNVNAEGIPNSTSMNMTPTTGSSTSTSANPGSTTPNTPAPSDQQSTTIVPKTVNVTIQNFAFSPQQITINQGDTVVWTNEDPTAHTVTGINGGPNSPDIQPNTTYSFTFNSSGTFNYHCTIHPTMTGSVQVN